MEPYQFLCKDYNLCCCPISNFPHVESASHQRLCFRTYALNHQTKLFPPPSRFPTRLVNVSEPHGLTCLHPFTHPPIQTVTPPHATHRSLPNSTMCLASCLFQSPQMCVRNERTVDGASIVWVAMRCAMRQALLRWETATNPSLWGGWG